MRGMHDLPAALLAGLVLAGLAAATPRLGGPMKHVLVSQSGAALHVTLEGDPNEVLLLQDYGETYAAPADVLDGAAYNGQYGWLASGAFSLPHGSGVYIARIDQSPGLATYAQGSFAPILGTAGADPVWQWNGTMVHNWYATRACGAFHATYEVFIGSGPASPLPDYAPVRVTLRWRYRADTIAGDVTGDLVVDFDDLLTVLGAFGDPGPGSPGDADGDGDTDIDDLLAVLAGFGRRCD